MILPFMLIRKISGGFHLKSSTVCLVSSTLLLSFVCLVSSTLLLSFFLLLIKVVTTKVRVIIFTCFVIASLIQIFLCSPIDNEARKLNEKEFSVFKTVARTMSILFLILYIILLLFGQIWCAAPVGAGIILTALLQVPCFFVRKITQE